MKQKPITSRERRLMKIAFEYGTMSFMQREANSFKDFINENNFVPGKLFITPWSIDIVKIKK